MRLVWSVNALDRRYVVVAPEWAEEYCVDHDIPYIPWNFERLNDRSMEIAETLQAAGVDVAIPRYEETVEWAGAINAVHLVEEIWRILRQRPIQVDRVQDMITQIAVYRSDPDVDGREDPGLDVYRSRLEAMDPSGMQYEAAGFARAMHDTGVVSPYHAELVRYLVEESDFLLAEALGLRRSG